VIEDSEDEDKTVNVEIDQPFNSSEDDLLARSTQELEAALEKAAREKAAIKQAVKVKKDAALRLRKIKLAQKEEMFSSDDELLLQATQTESEQAKNMRELKRCSYPVLLRRQTRLQKDR
jgi:hypothetical protein